VSARYRRIRRQQRKNGKPWKTRSGAIMGTTLIRYSFVTWVFSKGSPRQRRVEAHWDERQNRIFVPRLGVYAYEPKDRSPF
jgi:hypothetical protein